MERDQSRGSSTVACVFTHRKLAVRSSVAMRKSAKHLLNRFLQFLYHFNREEIVHATIIKCVTSPDLCAYLTWKNQHIHFCRGS